MGYYSSNKHIKKEIFVTLGMLQITGTYLVYKMKPLVYAIMTWNGKKYQKNRYINALGDYIFEVRTTIAFEEAVDNFFKKYNTIDASNENKLKQIIQKNYGTKLIFSRNKKCAQSLRKKLSKDFYVLQNYRS